MPFGTVVCPGHRTIRCACRRGLRAARACSTSALWVGHLRRMARSRPLPCPSARAPRRALWTHGSGFSATTSASTSTGCRSCISRSGRSMRFARLCHRRDARRALRRAPRSGQLESPEPSRVRGKSRCSAALDAWWSDARGLASRRRLFCSARTRCCSRTTRHPASACGAQFVDVVGVLLDAQLHLREHRRRGAAVRPASVWMRLHATLRHGSDSRRRPQSCRFRRGRTASSASAALPATFALVRSSFDLAFFAAVVVRDHVLRQTERAVDSAAVHRAAYRRHARGLPPRSRRSPSNGRCRRTPLDARRAARQQDAAECALAAVVGVAASSSRRMCSISSGSTLSDSHDGVRADAADLQPAAGAPARTTRSRTWTVCATRSTGRKRCSSARCASCRRWRSSGPKEWLRYWGSAALMFTHGYGLVMSPVERMWTNWAPRPTPARTFRRTSPTRRSSTNRASTSARAPRTITCSPTCAV